MAGLKGTYRYMEDANGVLQPNIFENDGMADLAQDNYLRQFKYNPRKYRHVKPVQMTNPGGVLAPAIIGAGAYIAGKNDLIGKGIDTVKNVDYATIPDRILGGLEKKAADLTVGAIEGGQYLKDKYNAAEDYLDEGLARVGDFFDRSPPTMTGGPMSRNGYRHHPGVPVPLDEYPSRHANPHAQVTIDNTPSHLIPGFDRMVNEGYDSWSPSDVDNYNNREYNIMRHGMDYPVDNRSDWQKWKDSVNSGRR